MYALPSRRARRPVVALDGVGVAGPLVAEQLAALVEQRASSVDEHPLVVVADLVAEVAEHRAVRLAEPDAQRFAMVVEGLGEVDGDDAVGVADHDRPRDAREQVEGQPALLLVVGNDGQAEFGESDRLVVSDLFPCRASRGRPCRRRRAGCVSGGTRSTERCPHVVDQPVASPFAVGTGVPRLVADLNPVRPRFVHRQRRSVKAHSEVAFRAFERLENIDGNGSVGIEGLAPGQATWRLRLAKLEWCGLAMMKVVGAPIRTLLVADRVEDQREDPPVPRRHVGRRGMHHGVAEDQHRAGRALRAVQAAAFGERPHDVGCDGPQRVAGRGDVERGRRRAVAMRLAG